MIWFFMIEGFWHFIGGLILISAMPCSLCVNGNENKLKCFNMKCVTNSVFYVEQIKCD